MSESGQIWTWGKGDYYRLGHSSDQHVRRPQLVEGLRGLKVVDVAVGALHCLAVTDTGKVSVRIHYKGCLMVSYLTSLKCGTLWHLCIFHYCDCRSYFPVFISNS